ncbi:MAG TPA: hypothetical protein VIM64_11535 [Puia sp.]
MFCTAQAQTLSTPAVDTLSGTDTISLVTPLNYFSGTDGIFSASVAATKISGTTSAVCVLRATVDGITYLPVTGTSSDTFTLTNVATRQVRNWYIGNTKVKAAQIYILSTGSQSTQVKGYFIKK